jgi:hypothetical protein
MNVPLKINITQNGRLWPLADAILDSKNQCQRFSGKLFQPIESERTEDRFQFSLSRFVQKIQKGFSGIFSVRFLVACKFVGKGKCNCKRDGNNCKRLRKNAKKISFVKFLCSCQNAIIMLKIIIY